MTLFIIFFILIILMIVLYRPVKNIRKYKYIAFFDDELFN